jgi:hypothetical protein
VSRTISQRLNEACRQRGYAWVARPDEAVTSPPYTIWWGCVYQPKTGAVLALVTAAPARTVKRGLLERLETQAPPPTVRTVRKGVVIGVRNSRVTIEFEDTARDGIAYPYGVSVEPGMAVRAVWFGEDEQPVLLYGEPNIVRTALPSFRLSAMNSRSLSRPWTEREGVREGGGGLGERMPPRRVEMTMTQRWMRVHLRA